MPLDSAPIVYFENMAGRLLEDPAGFLRVEWRSEPRPPGAARELFDQMGLALRQHGWSRILINQGQMQPFSREEQQWVTEHWLPNTVREAGYRFGAVVVSSSVLTRLATAYITTHVQGLPLTYRSFDSDAAAAAWLEQQPG
ncbi:hypothetical protein GCM10027048_06360 [Hymenobacter coalescens]